MVNIAHRMRKLQSLLHIRLGLGAGKLPPTVQKIHLELAQNILPEHAGPKQFWRQILPRLKYHNPSIPMTVSRFPTRDHAPKLLIHTSASPEPITLEVNGMQESAILDSLLENLGGGFQEVQATPQEMETLEELKEQKAKAEVDSEKGKRKRMQMKKQKEMLEMASQGAI